MAGPPFPADIELFFKDVKLYFGPSEIKSNLKTRETRTAIA